MICRGVKWCIVMSPIQSPTETPKRCWLLCPQKRAKRLTKEKKMWISLTSTLPNILSFKSVICKSIELENGFSHASILTQILFNFWALFYNLNVMKSAYLTRGWLLFFVCFVFLQIFRINRCFLQFQWNP